MAKKPKHTAPTRNGGQLYQSPRGRKSMRSTAGQDDLGRRMDKVLDEAMFAKKISPETAGNIGADLFTERANDAYSSRRRDAGARKRSRDRKTGRTRVKGKGKK